MAFEKIDSQNNKRPGSHPRVLLYGLTESEIRPFKQRGDQEGVEVVCLYRDQLKTPVADLLSQTFSPGEKGKVSLVLFNDLSQKEMKGWVDGLKEWLTDWPLLAMVTDQSKTWLLGQLLAELTQERKDLKG